MKDKWDSKEGQTHSVEEESSLSEKIIEIKIRDEKKFITNDKIKQEAIWHKYLLEKDLKEFIRQVIEEDLEMCKVCGGSHGTWLDKDDFVKKFKKRVGEKLLK